MWEDGVLENRDNWMTYLQEYDTEFKPIHTIKGHGLCKLVTEASDAREQDLLGWEKEIEMYNIDHVPQSTSIAPCYVDLRQFLDHGTLLSHLSNKQKREIYLKYLSYQLVHGFIFQKHHNGVLLRCLEPQDTEKFLKYLQDGPIGGHYAGDTTTHKVMQASYYYPTLFKDVHAYVHKC